MVFQTIYGLETISSYVKFLTHLESKTSQFEIVVFQLLAGYNLQFQK